MKECGHEMDNRLEAFRKRSMSHSQIHVDKTTKPHMLRPKDVDVILHTSGMSTSLLLSSPLLSSSLFIFFFPMSFGDVCHVSLVIMKKKFRLSEWLEERRRKEEEV